MKHETRLRLVSFVSVLVGSIATTAVLSRPLNITVLKVDPEFLFPASPYLMTTSIPDDSKIESVFLEIDKEQTKFKLKQLLELKKGEQILIYVPKKWEGKVEIFKHLTTGEK